MDRCKVDHAQNECGQLAHTNVDSQHSSLSAANLDGLKMSSSSRSDGDYSLNDNGNGDFLNTVFEYITEVLMDEDLESQLSTLQDNLALQAAEKSFYAVLGQKYPPSPDQPSCGSNASNDSCNQYATINIEQTHLQISTFNPPDNAPLRPVAFGNIQHYQQFEANKSLPQVAENGSRGRKTCQRDYQDEERSSKQSATTVTESQLSEQFDKLLLFDSEKADDESISCPIYEGAQKKENDKVEKNSKGSNRRRRTHAKKKAEEEVVDLFGLLTRCARAVSCFDQRQATDLLTEIRQHSSPLGDATQRVAYYFADALEVRLNGNEIPQHTHVKGTAEEWVKGYLAYISVCPFRWMSDSFSNRTIEKLAAHANRVHIVDFGIVYGFQWPSFIQRISRRPGGPPRLRITGIEFPQPGFRPAERAEEAGRRLKSYCDRFNVPFEYIAIAQKWETIRLEDIKLDKQELTVVSCVYKLKNIPDDTMALTSARDKVLNLIKNLEPNLFIHGVINGTFGGPFFTTRFREALHFYSTVFDIFEATLPREDEGRLMFERDGWARDILNVIACEGAKRVERPETYKQWQARNTRIGLRQVQLDQAILMQVREAVKSKYHKDFSINEDGHWMLQGWKGRTVYALSCWKPES